MASARHTHHCSALKPFDTQHTSANTRRLRPPSYGGRVTLIKCQRGTGELTLYHQMSTLGVGFVPERLVPKSSESVHFAFNSLLHVNAVIQVHSGSCPVWPVFHCLSTEHFHCRSEGLSTLLQDMRQCPSSTFSADVFPAVWGVMLTLLKT